MTGKPSLSFVLPAYKATYLKLAIDSILKQSYKDFELIIINDHSPENISEIVEQFNDKRIRYYINESNLGGISLVAQWNHCLTFVTTDYFVLASDDDIYVEGYLEEMLKLIRKYPLVDVVHSRVGIIDSAGKIVDYSCIAPEFETCVEFMWHKMKGFRQQFIPEFMFKTNSLKDKGGFIDFPSATGSDYATCFNAALDHGVAYSNMPLLHWRSSEINISSGTSHSNNKLKAIFPLIIWLENFVDRNDFSNEDITRKMILDEIIAYRERTISNILIQSTYSVNFHLLLNGSTINGDKISFSTVIKSIFTKFYRSLKNI